MAGIRQKFSQMNPYLKGIILFLGGVLILLVILQTLVSLFADDMAANYLKDQVKTSSHSTYALTFDDLDLRIFDGSATIQNLRIHADTAAFSDTAAQHKPAAKLFSGTVGEFDISGINVFSAIWGQQLNIGTIRVSQPNIRILRNPHDIAEDTTASKFSSVDSSIYATISNRYKALEIGEIRVDEGRAILTQRSDTLSYLGRLNLSLQNIRIDSSTAQSGRRFITHNISMDASDFRYKLSDSLNAVTFNHLTVSSETQRIQFDSLGLEPRYPRFEYSRQKGYHSDWLDIDIPEFYIQGLDFSRYIDSGEVRARYAEINNARMVDFLNKAYPGGPPQQKKLPHTAFKSSAQPIKIDSLKINNSFISYSEYLSQAPRAGILTFEQLNASLYNLSNFEDDVQNGLTTVLDVRTRVMGSGLLTAHYEFPLDTEIGFHKINGRLGKMPMTDFNRMLEYVAFVRIDSGQLHSMEFDLTLDQDRANGNLIMLYENFKISILDKKSIQQEGLLKNFMTFVANNFIVNRNNTPEKGMEAGRIQYQRDDQKSVFNYWWKSLLSGIKDSIK